MTNRTDDKPAGWQPPASVDIVLVVAQARNRVIGAGGTMPWRMPGDLKVFRRLTMGRPIIMGRRTFEAIGRPLDGRTNIVVTRNEAFAAPGVTIAPDLDVAFEAATAALGETREIMIIGGGEIYAATLPYATRIFLTEIDATPPGDTYFPELDAGTWREVERTPIPPDPRDDHAATLVTLERNPAQ